MVLESLMLLLALATPPRAPRLRLAPAPLLALAAPAAYQPQERAVGNWRFESALGLDLPPLGALKQFAGTAPAQTPRCVKLNNYWCIKRAGWNGEIASDPDGHVAFASAQEGAAVAALLLRRYYIEFKRHTAREIASRWAPSQCAAPAVAIGVSPVVSRMLPQRPVPMGLATHGLFNTVRARWLATHLPGGAPRAGFRRPPPARVRLTSLAPAPMTPSITAHETSETEPKTRIFAHEEAPPAAPLVCTGDLIRINNYATHIAEGIAPGPDQDLHLFTADGQPTENFARALANMAAVEIGPLRAHPSLVAFAVAQLRLATPGQ
ncbi:MAG TPA: hypothetical protein VIF61_13875 [Methylocystis sp.]|jgi:hypothetical protein